MVQTTNRFFDDMARLMNDAAGMAQGLRREAETMFRGQAERILNEFAVVQREEFEAVREMARLAREENEKLRARIAALEAQIGGAHAAGQTTVAGSTEPPPSNFA
jgi:BMFP domain-containing protein YqiC